MKIPIGVDVHKYRSQLKYGSEDIRKKLGIGQDVTLIGSFQKDGNGWGEGLTPKAYKRARHIPFGSGGTFCISRYSRPANGTGSRLCHRGPEKTENTIYSSIS